MTTKKLPLFLFTLLILSVVTVQCKKEKEDEKDNNNNGQPSALLFTQAEKDTIFAGDSATAMRILNYFIPEDSVILRSISKDVSVSPNDTIIKRLTDRMLTAARNIGVGIAAPQVGILRNVIWVQRYDKGTYSSRPFEAYLNPKITAYSDTLVQRNDGCLSVPQSAEYPSVINYSYRALWVDVEYYLLNGQFVQERITHTFTAHIFQHEIDHLKGIMFFDRFEPRLNENTVIIPYNPDDYNDVKLEMLGN